MIVFIVSSQRVQDTLHDQASMTEPGVDHAWVLQQDVLFLKELEQKVDRVLRVRASDEEHMRFIAYNFSKAWYLFINVMMDSAFSLDQGIRAVRVHIFIDDELVFFSEKIINCRELPFSNHSFA